MITAAETETIRLTPRGNPAPLPAPDPQGAIPSKAPLSKLALASLSLAILSAMGLAGIPLQRAALLVVGILIAVGAILAGVLCLVLFGGTRKARGVSLAVPGIVVAALLTLLYFAILGGHPMGAGREGEVDLPMVRTPPTESELSALDPGSARALRANVVIEATPRGVFGPPRRFGSGIFLRAADGKAFILTNRHVVGPADPAEAKIEVLYYSGERFACAPVWVAPEEIDAMILASPSPTRAQCSPVVVDRATASRGLQVFAVGNPEGLAWSYTEGVISGTRPLVQGTRKILLYQTQTPIGHGSSGGGLYDRKGRLLGLNTWMKGEGGAMGLNFAIGVGSIIELLNGEDLARFFGEVPLAPAGSASEEAIP